MRLKPATRDRARELRRMATPAERKLWNSLRELNREGFHFRRQAPFRGYFLDFVEHRRKLAIEVDGDTHASQADRLRDAQRDRVLMNEGYRGLRFWNSEIRESVEGVILKILSEI